MNLKSDFAYCTKPQNKKCLKCKRNYLLYESGKNDRVTFFIPEKKCNMYEGINK
jgi:hypothetical protein